MDYTVPTSPAPVFAEPSVPSQQPATSIAAAAATAAEAVAALFPDYPRCISSTPGLSTPPKRKSPDFDDYEEDSDIEPAMLLLKLSQSPAVHKRKRQRTSPEQLDLLEQMFEQNTMPNQQTRITLASQLGMSARRIQIWFQNKRAKVRRTRLRSSGEDALCELSRQGLDNSEDDASDAEECSPSNAASVSPSRADSPAQRLVESAGSPPAVSPSSSFITQPVPISVPTVVFPILEHQHAVAVATSSSPAPRLQ